MPGYHNILSKIDRALVAFIIQQNAGTLNDTVPAKTGTVKGLPVTLVHTEDAEENPPRSSDFLADTQITIKTAGPTQSTEKDVHKARLASEARVALVFSCFFLGVDSAADKLAEAITTAARNLAAADALHHGDLKDFTCLDVRIAGVGQGPEEGTAAWLDLLRLKIAAVPYDVS